jgi:hypothetical protein
MLRSRRRSRRPVLVAVLALSTAVAGGVAAVVARSGRRPSLPSLPGPLARFSGPSKPGSEDWRCACGARYRVSGIDRHRVYWAEGAAENEPVLGTDCVSCGRPLPA